MLLYLLAYIQNVGIYHFLRRPGLQLPELAPALARARTPLQSYYIYIYICTHVCIYMYTITCHIITILHYYCII